MNNFSINILLLNKIVLFLDNYLNDNIDYLIFKKNAESEIEFINNHIGGVFDDSDKLKNILLNDNLNKLMFSLLQRFDNNLNKFIDYYKLNNIDYKFLEFTLSNVRNKKNILKSLVYRNSITNTDKQYINHNEYEILFKSFND